jgi:hypothetical protein
MISSEVHQVSVYLYYLCSFFLKLGGTHSISVLLGIVVGIGTLHLFPAADQTLRFVCGYSVVVTGYVI